MVREVLFSLPQAKHPAVKPVANLYSKVVTVVLNQVAVSYYRQPTLEAMVKVVFWCLVRVRRRMAIAGRYTSDQGQLQAQETVETFTWAAAA